MLDVPLQKSEARPVKLGGKCQIHMSNVKSKYSREKSEIQNPKSETMTKIQNKFISNLKCQKSNLQVKSQKLMK